MNVKQVSKTFEVNGAELEVTVRNSYVYFESWANGYKAYSDYFEPTIGLDYIKDVLADFCLKEFDEMEILDFIDRSECYS